MSPSDKKLIEDQQLHIQALENEIRMLKNAKEKSEKLTDGLREQIKELQESTRENDDLKDFVRDISPLLARIDIREREKEFQHYALWTSQGQHPLQTEFEIEAVDFDEDYQQWEFTIWADDLKHLIVCSQQSDGQIKCDLTSEY
ncbi:MAG: hypothetical protein AAFQ91_18395 [Cyanobacteria bacterium J06621_15]